MLSIVKTWPFFISVPTEMEKASQRAMQRFAQAEKRTQNPESRDTLSQIERNIGDIRARAESIDE